MRVRHDGRQFTIVDHPRPPNRLVEVFATAGLEVDVETLGPRFCLVSGQKPADGTTA